MLKKARKTEKKEKRKSSGAESQASQSTGSSMSSMERFRMRMDPRRNWIAELRGQGLKGLMPSTR